MIGAVVLAAVSALPVQQAEGTVTGRIRSAASQAPLRGAVVEVVARSPADAILVEADENGYYTLRNVPAGRRLIRASHLDHAPHQVEIIVSAGVRTNVDIDLVFRPVRLPRINARAVPVEVGRRDTASIAPPDIGSAAVRAMEATPGVAELGLAEAAREVPGHEPIDPSDVLFVRGGAADLKLVLLNGAPVFAPFHIGGLIHALETDVLQSATIYLGGAPARYDGGLSYVMDLETRSGRETRQQVRAAIDLLAARVIAEGPIVPGTSYMVAGRGVHGYGTSPFVGDPFPYGYGDAMGRIDIDIGRGRTLTGTGFLNEETVRLDSLRSPDRVAGWGNRAGSLRYLGPMLGGRGTLTLAAGTFETRLPVGSLQPLLTEGASRRWRVTADFTRALGQSRLQYGASYDRVEFDQLVQAQTSGGDSVVFSSGTAGSVVGAYMELIVNASDRFQLRGGMRADRFALEDGIRVGPRASATLTLAEGAQLTLAAGRYRQYISDTEEPLAVIGTALPNPGESQRLAVAGASHFVLGIDQRLPDGVRLSVEGFYKAFDGLPTTADGTAEASGVDVWVRRNQGRFRGWFGYSLAWVWHDDENPRSATHLFAGRQLVTGGLAGPVIGQGSFDVRVSYGSGLPFAAIPEPEAGTPVFSVHPVETISAAREPLPALPAAPDQPYLRVDAQLARTWDAEFNGIAFQLTPYVKVLNALNRRDGIFYYYDRGAGSPARALAGLPVLPIVGLDWRF
ncbi:MAG: TonB-dependent receptor [Gemmatimonadetes bacterium]|nr:TonB-dependent receptor [Gemmatimonadota bacterium]